jgi:hypothetical protein
VSAKTVSRVINNARYVSPGVRQRVEPRVFLSYGSASLVCGDDIDE